MVWLEKYLFDLTLKTKHLYLLRLRFFFCRKIKSLWSFELNKEEGEETKKKTYLGWEEGMSGVTHG